MIDNQVITLLLEITTTLESRLNSLLQKEFNISVSDYKVLSTLSEVSKRFNNEPVKQELVVEELNFDKSTISRRFKNAEKQKLITRKINKLSEREKLVSLTEKGQGLINQADEEINRFLSDSLQRLNAYDQKQLQIYLRSILNGFGASN